VNEQIAFEGIDFHNLNKINKLDSPSIDVQMLGEKQK